MLLLVLILVGSITYSIYMTVKYTLVRKALIDLDKETKKLLDELSKIADWSDF